MLEQKFPFFIFGFSHGYPFLNPMESKTKLSLKRMSNAKCLYHAIHLKSLFLTHSSSFILIFYIFAPYFFPYSFHVFETNKTKNL